MRGGAGWRRIATAGGFASLVLFGSVAAPASTMTFKAGCSDGDRITIAAVGDLLFHKKIQVQAYRGNTKFTRFWKPVEPLLKAADITYGNLETPSAHGVSRYGREVRDTRPALWRSLQRGTETASVQRSPFGSGRPC